MEWKFNRYKLKRINKMKTICDRCDKYEVTPCGTIERCSAFIDRSNRFINGITKPYIEERMIGNINHCKEFKPIRK